MKHEKFTLLPRARKPFILEDVKEPQLYREQFPYSEVPRILFDNEYIVPEAATEIWITDTSFRDGQQARPPYTVRQIVDLYTLLHRLGPIVRQSEFFLYSQKDQRAVEKCLELGLAFPEVTGWIRANTDDFKLVKRFGLKETGILTSVSDYHIFLKLRKSRRKAMEDYLAIVEAAMQEGIIPRCHFEDITRADIHGFCLPFAEELMKLSEKSGIPVKIRLCDTMGFGLTYPGAVLPRSVPKLAAAFCKELGMPGQMLEWHGHNDFHKVHINASTAWLYGVSGLNASLLGYGERTGNPPLEAAVIEYLSLTGDNESINTPVITEIADYFRDQVHAEVPRNYPFIGKEFNTTRAGIHADGLLKNPEIYNIFDTEKILNRPIMVSVTDKSGAAGIAHWLNQYAQKLSHVNVEHISKRHPGVRRILNWVNEQYEHGRTTSISADEMLAQAKRNLPQMFESDFSQIKEQVRRKAKIIAERISNSPALRQRDSAGMEQFLKDMTRDESFIHFLAVANINGSLISQMHAQRGEKAQFRQLRDENFADHFWFPPVRETGRPFFSDVYDSRFTGALIMTAAYPLVDENGQMIGIIDIDFKFEEMLKLLNDLPEDIMEPEHE